MSLFSRKKWILFLVISISLVFILIKLIHFDFLKIPAKETYTSINPNKESCFICHDQNTGFSEYHNPVNIGCTSCHLGNPKSDDIDEAHKNMVLIPGNLSNADETCGKCHVNELNKIKHSLMTTNSGLIAVDKFIFGEADSPNHQYHIKNLEFSAADKHLRDLCANCHLGAEKKEFGEINQLSRGGGCNACHLNYSKESKSDLEKYMSSGKKDLPSFHPSTDIFVKDEHCFGCHSRSSRISTNYEGWHETLLDEEDVLNKKNYKVIEDKRVYKYMGGDIHHEKGLLCVDCHSSHEVMGDGKDYLHEENAVTLTCADCHFEDKPNTIDYQDLDNESALVFLHRKYEHTDKKMLAVKKDGHPLVNTFVDDDDAVFLIGKGDQKLHPIRKQSDICSRDSAHKTVSCSTCHSQWAPRCIGCHNSFDENDKMGYDLLDKKEVVGQWIEYVAEFDASLPAMGVRFGDNHREIEPAIPGMILTIDHQSFSGVETDQESFHRLYAPNSPHTTSKNVRDCKSCHASSSAIGYGNGSLTFNIENGKGKWEFIPEYDLSKQDQLPEDAWIPFLKEQEDKIYSTRTDFRPFNLNEQKQILLVGACLQCHADTSAVMKTSLINGIDSMLKNLSENCILPTY